jgi:hypothetical protein
MSDLPIFGSSLFFAEGLEMDVGIERTDENSFLAQRNFRDRSADFTDGV